MKDDKIWCKYPCVDCENHRSHLINVVKRYLFGHEICSYEAQYLHGEAYFNSTSTSNGKEHIIEEDVGDTMFDMINDFEEHFMRHSQLFKAIMTF